MGARRKARECALQMLFQYDIQRLSPIGPMPSVDELIESYWNEISDIPRPEEDDFSIHLVKGTIDHLTEIDDRIRNRTEHWRISRMHAVDRNLLRLAVYEFLYEMDTPKTVVINEALEIARRFSTYEATQFINGILDGIKRDLELTPQNASNAKGAS